MKIFWQFHRGRQARGSNVVEFSACIVIIFFALLVPMIDLGTMLTRWATASQVVSAWTASIAKERKLSTAFNRLTEGSEFTESVKGPTGISISQVEPSLIACPVGRPENCIEVVTPGRLPKRWLPNAGQFTYLIRVAVEADVEPLLAISFFGLKVPGLTTSTHIRMVGESNWENLGRDPASKEFFINE